MANANQIPWKRILAESTAIVASILLAFAIDAWWEEAQDIKRAHSHLVALHEEFSANLELLHEIVSRNKEMQAAANFLLEIITERRERPSNEELVASTWLAFDAARFEPLATAYQNLISTGDIALIRDEQLKFDIASFMTATELYRRQDATFEQWNRIIQPFINTEMVPLDWAPKKFRAENGMPDPVDGTDWDRVLKSRQFEGILVNRVIASQDNVGRLNGILPAAERIVHRLDALIGTE